MIPDGTIRGSSPETGPAIASDPAMVDIVMPLYNKAATVRRAIRSIQHQQVTDWRLIVVDDGSTDESAEVVRGIDDPRIVLLQQANQGPGGARNTGIAHATAEYIAFLDGDDEWYPWYLANALEAIRWHPVSLVGSLYYEWPSQREMTDFWRAAGIIRGCYQLRGDEDPRWVFRLTPFFSPWNSLLRLDTIRQYGCFYDKDHCRRAEDETLFIRIVFNEPFMIIGPPAIRYHTETSSIGHTGRAHPPEPFLQDPAVLLDHCPGERQWLMTRLIDRRALWTAETWAYYGRKQQAEALLARFPGARSYEPEYRRYRYIAHRRPLWWTRLRCFVGPPIRQLAGGVARRLGMVPVAPPMPWEAASSAASAVSEPSRGPKAAPPPY